jgi:putative endopeptidase
MNKEMMANMFCRLAKIYKMKIIYSTLFEMTFCLFACKDNKTGSNNINRSLGDILATHIDSSIHPGNDFFNYANGGWIKNNPIPKSESGWGIFNLVADENYAQIKKISEDASASNASKGSPQQQIGDFFYCGMDSLSIEKNGISPLKNELAKIEAIKSNTDVVNLLTEFQTIGVAGAYSIGIAQDMKNSQKNQVYFAQGGLGLPDRDYYFNNDTRTKNIRNEYAQHVANMLTLVYQDTTKANLNSVGVIKLETDLAASHKKLEELRDPYANYNKMSVSQVNKLTPLMNWTEAFKKMNINSDSVIVGQPAFFAKLNTLLSSVQPEIWKAYLTWHLVSTYSGCVSSAFDKENFNFYNKTLSGSKEQRPRWKRVLDAQESALGDALGQLFVKEYFPAKTKKRYDDLVEQIVISYREHIQKLDWMSDSTKQKAITKLNAITKKVGYPNKWKDYSQMNIGKESYCKNVMESEKCK